RTAAGVVLLGLTIAHRATTQVVAVSASDTYLSNWPAAAAPRDVAKRLADNWARRTFGFTTNPPGRYDSFVHYSEVAAWYGALDVAALLHDRALEQHLVDRFQYFETKEGDAHISREAHVDFSIFGAIPLELHRHVSDAKHLALGLQFADRQWANATPDGMSRE